MSNPSKVIGTRAETKVARYFTANGLPTERKALAGSADNGDLRMLLPDGTEVTVEVKAGKQTHDYRRSSFEEWKRQTAAESFNSGCPAILVIVKYGKPFRNSEVWVPNEEWGMDGWTMLYIDDYVKQMQA